MKTSFIAALCLGLASLSAQAAPGEYWEVTTKMDMAGMPMQMPTITAKVCVPAGSEKNPQYMQKKDNKCQMTDVKTSGNKVSWKVSCVEHGETMTGSGESTHEGNSYRGTMHLKGITHGQAFDMTQTYSGRKVGGACDSEEQLRELKKKAESACETVNYSATDWINGAPLFLKGGACTGKKEQLCTNVRRDAARNASTYQALINSEKYNNALIATACGLDLESLRVSVCKASKEGDYDFLKANCPTEAKAYLESSRQNCAGRSYTARLAAGCQSGGDHTGSSRHGANATHQPAEETGQPVEQGKPTGTDNLPPTGNVNVNVDAVVEGAKKLKGLFGF